MNLEHEIVKAVTRRYFFGQCGTGLGLGAIAPSALLAKQASADGVERELGLELDGFAKAWVACANTSFTYTWPACPASLICLTTSRLFADTGQTVSTGTP